LITEFFEYLQMDFAMRALIVGVLLAVCAALLGVCLVPKRYSMIGDGLSHVGFGALAVASALGTAPLAIALPVVIIASFLLLRLRENGKIKGDSAVAMISAGALAIGVMIVSLSGSNTDLDGYMFGSLLSVTRADFFTAIVIFPLVISIFVIFYTQIFAVSYDENFARATGMKEGFYNTLLSVLIAVTIVMGMRLMGTLLISALIIFPSISAMRVCRSYFFTVITAVALSVVSFISGMVMSFAISTPIGASIVICNMISFFLMSAIGSIVKKKRA
jgi:zinc transport system permease protein